MTSFPAISGLIRCLFKQGVERHYPFSKFRWGPASQGCEATSPARALPAPGPGEAHAAVEMAAGCMKLLIYTIEELLLPSLACTRASRWLASPGQSLRHDRTVCHCQGGKEANGVESIESRFSHS